MTSRPAYDVLCAGLIVADHVCRSIPRLPPPGGLMLTAGMELTVGGCAANVAVDFSRLSRPVTICGCVGTDVFGRHVGEILRNAGVCCEHLQVIPKSETSCTVVLNIANEDRRFIHTLGANAEFRGETITPALIARCRAVYFGGYGLVDSLGPDEVHRVFSEARKQNVMTVLDVVLSQARDYSTWIAPLLPLTDLFLPNSDEARLLLGDSDPLRQAERFHADGAQVAVVTCGADGAVLVGDALRLRVAAHPVECVDGTGSGDAFLTGLLHARLDGADWETSLKYAAALGACCVQSPGATAGIPDAETLRRHVESQPLAVVPV